MIIKRNNIEEASNGDLFVEKDILLGREYATQCLPVTVKCGFHLMSDIILIGGQVQAYRIWALKASCWCGNTSFGRDPLVLMSRRWIAAFLGTREGSGNAP